MKKMSVIVLIIALSFLMAACSKKSESGTSTETPSTSSPSIATTSPSTSTSSPSTSTSSPSTSTSSPSTSSPSATATKYKDGSYDEKGDPWAQGQEEAVIIIKDGKISSVSLMRLDKAGKEIDYSKFDGKVHDGKTYPDLKKFRETLAKKIIEIQSAQFDTISGATVSTGNWKVAAQKALEKASKEKK